MKITDKTFTLDMADMFDAGLTVALAKDSEVFSFDYAGLEVTAPVAARRQVAGCHPEMKCVVLLWPAALADLLIEGIPVVRSQIEEIAGKVISGELAECGVTCITEPPASPPIACEKQKGHEGEHQRSYRVNGKLDGFRRWPNPQVTPLPLQ